MNQHLFLDGSPSGLPLGKAVCIARNYVAHAQELGNQVPSAPLFFHKPSTSVVPLEPAFALPRHGQDCQHELELALVLGQEVGPSFVGDLKSTVAGYALGLDLTLRDVQQKLKEKGYPWELAKSFDGALPLSPLIPFGELTQPEDVELCLKINGQIRQQASTNLMIVPIWEQLEQIRQVFTLLPGDILMTGTPAGVGPLRVGDLVDASLGGRWTFSTLVR